MNPFPTTSGKAAKPTMNDTTTVERENIAATLARELPKPQVIHQISALADGDAILHLAVPKNFEHKVVDNEVLLPNPRRTKATASLTEPEDFVRYVLRHGDTSTVVWAHFDPQTYALKFTAVFDEHAKGAPGWRKHQAVFTPEPAPEWKTWTGQDGKTMSQLEFALFLENREDDIANVDNRPTHLDMTKMALEFEARQDQAIKSAVRLQNGGVELSYIGNDDAQTLEKMKVFEKFTIGIPVFRGVKDELGKAMGYLVDARLRYRTGQGKVLFWYELIRPDKTHELAAQHLIKTVRDGIGDVPMLMGSCS